jgi:hypothetical protein
MMAAPLQGGLILNGYPLEKGTGTNLISHSAKLQYAAEQNHPPGSSCLFPLLLSAEH